MQRFSRTALAAAFALTASAAVASAQTPLLQYTFDEPTGQAIDTGTPPPANGDLVGGAVRTANTPSGLGSAVDFTNDNPFAHVLGPDADKLDGHNQLTLTTWLNVSEYTSGNNRLVAKQSGGAFGGFSFGMNATTNDGPVGADNFRLSLFLGNNISSGASDFGAAFSSADVDAADKWVFLAATYDGTQASNNVTYWIGDTASSVSQLGTAQTVPQLTVDGGTARFGVGFTDAAPTANTSALGFQDDVRVYGSSLTSTELEAIRLQNIPEPTSIAAFGALGLLSLRRRRA